MDKAVPITERPGEAGDTFVSKNAHHDQSSIPSPSSRAVPDTPAPHGRTHGLRSRLLASPARSALLAVAAIAAVSALFWLSAQLIGLDKNGILGQTFGAMAGSYWALPVVALAFSLASLIGAPQFLLIAVTVAAFGPAMGFLYSVLATLVSASFNFLAARYLGADWLRRRGWSGLSKIMDGVSRNGFMAALLVRVVPSAPFIVVNMGLGLTQTPYAAFIAGTAIGILPKTALIALLGKVVERAQSGDADAIVYLVIAAACWLALALTARHVLRLRELRRQRAAQA